MQFVQIVYPIRLVLISGQNYIFWAHKSRMGSKSFNLFSRRRFILAALFVVFLQFLKSSAMVEQVPKILGPIPQANNQFTLDVLQKVIQDQAGNDENRGKAVIISPFNVANVLAMVMLGANGTTLDQMATTLRLKSGDQTATFGDVQNNAFQEALSQVYRKLAGAENVTLALGNGVYPDKNFPLNPAFVEGVTKYYKAPVTNLDFVDNPAGALEYINGQVAKATGNKIPNLLPPGSIKPATKLVLTSAIFFKGDWDKPFKQNETVPKQFNMDSGNQVSIPFMNSKDSAAYFSDRATVLNLPGPVKILRLDYTNKDMSLFIILPPQGQLTQLIQNLDAQLLNNLSGGLYYKRNLDISIPKFKIDTSVEMKNILVNLKMTDVFGTQADLSGLTIPQGGDEKRLAVDEIYHKASIEVNEEGSIAAAASGATIMLMSMPIPAAFIADHPFLYYIMDRSAGTILFIGTFTGSGQQSK